MDLTTKFICSLHANYAAFEGVINSPSCALIHQQQQQPLFNAFPTYMSFN
jgi:hypothetical protein